ncbi:hypothetical protein [Leifsonia kafniensis]
MPTFHDPVADGDEAREAMRALAHATRAFEDPTQTYDVIGNLIAAVRSLRQVLEQVAATHLDHRDRALTGAGDSVAGAADAQRAANALQDSAWHLGFVEINLDAASQHSGRIVWQTPLTPASPHRAVVTELAARLGTAAPFSRPPQGPPRRGMSL